MVTTTLLIASLLVSSVFCMLPWQPLTATSVSIANSNVINKINKEYLSFNLDTSYLQPEIHRLLNFSSPRLHTTLKAMSPAIFRVGGSPADWLIFNRPQKALNASGINKVPVVMTKSDWDDLVTVTSRADLRLLFDLDLQLRYGTQWDPSGAIELFDYSVERGYGANLDWELGNEENVYASPMIKLSGDEIGRDYVSLAKLVRSYPEFRGSRVVGPDVVGDSAGATDVMKGVLNHAGKYIDALTIHQYYFRGDIAHVKDYLDPRHFASLAGSLAYTNKVITSSAAPHTPLWIGETSDAWHAGTEGVSDRYVSAFLWLDKLGLAATMGVTVVMRQTYWGHNYALVDNDFNPNPDYWLSLMHKKLVGVKVLNISTTDHPLTTRVYAHCARHKTPGSVVVFALNINQTSAAHLTFPDAGLQGQTLQLYLAQPGDGEMLSKTVLLNGVPLKMRDDHTMPHLRPIPLPVSNGVTLPPLTYAFMVLPDAGLKVCD